MRAELPQPEQLMELAAISSFEMLTVRKAGAFEHLIENGRPEFVAELKVFEAIVSTIGLSAREASPPPGLRAKLLARLVSPNRT